MKNNFIESFIAKYSKLEFEEYYKSHTNAETFAYFGITKRQLAELKQYWNIPDKTNIKSIIEKLDQNEFIEYYQTHSNNEVFEQYNIDYNTLNSIRKILGIKPRTQEQLKQINLRLYGVEYTGQREDVIKAINKAKNITTIGYKDILQNYNTDFIIEYLNTHATDEICNFFNTTYDNIKKLRQNLNIDGKTQVEKEKINLRRFGVKNVFQLKAVKEKSKQTLISKYGVINIGQTQEQKDKAIATKKQNGTFNTSKPEESIYNMLKNIYGEENIIRQYTDSRYPYNCDFYIKSLDLFLEINYSWTHGEAPYIGSPEQEAILNTWRSVGTEYYLNAIDTWTRRDVAKLQTAINNNLNFLFLYKNDDIRLLNNLELFTLDFPYPNSTMQDTTDLGIIKYFHKSIYAANKRGKLAPIAAWNNKLLMKEAILNGLQYKDKDILTPEETLARFFIAKIAPKVSVFNPKDAENLIKKYLNEYNTIFDPCCGYSGRMIGASKANKYYIGRDINETTINECNELKDFLKIKADIKVADSLSSIGQYECLFTCPPYGNKENWAQDIEVLSADEWIDACLKNYDCKAYLFVVDKTVKYKDYIVEHINHRSHFANSTELVILIEPQEK